MTVFDERWRPSLARDGSFLPEGWAEVTLAGLVVHRIGGEWGEESWAEGLVPARVVRGTEFRDWEREKGKSAARRWLSPAQLAVRELQMGDVVIEISGGGPSQAVGRTLLIDAEALLQGPLPPLPLVCSNFCRLLRFHPAVDSTFVHLAIREKYLSGAVWEFQDQNTTNLHNLKLDDFLEGLWLRLPPLAEQRRIVVAVQKLLRAVSAGNENLQKAVGVLRKLRQRVLAAGTEGRLTAAWRRDRPAAPPPAALLGPIFEERRKGFESAARQAVLAGAKQKPRAPLNLEPGVWEVPAALALPEFPAGWSVAALQDLVTGLQYGTSTRAEKDVKDGVAVLRMGNIRDGRLDARRAKLKWVAAGSEDVERYLLRPGDILFNRTNSPELVGKAAVFESEEPMIFASYLVRITCDERLILPQFLCSWINSPWGRSWARAVRSDCVSQSNINVSKLRSMPVPLPPLEEQRESVRRMQEAAAAAEQIQEGAEAASAYAERMPRAILEQAMQGDLVPTEADLARSEGREYEPAVLLLDRIRTGLPIESEVRPLRKSRRKRSGFSPEDLLAAIRRASWGSLERTPDELVDAVIERLKDPEPDPELRSTLLALVETAIERRILAPQGTRLVGATPKIGRYDDEFLLSVLGRVMRDGVSYSRKQLSRAMVSWLGYDQLTAAMVERLGDLFPEAIRRGLLVVDADRYSFNHSNSS